MKMPKKEFIPVVIGVASEIGVDILGGIAVNALLPDDLGLAKKWAARFGGWCLSSAVGAWTGQVMNNSAKEVIRAVEEIIKGYKEAKYGIG